MKRFTKQVATAAAGLGMVAVAAAELLACGGAGGGGFGGFGGYGGGFGGYRASRSVYYQQPVYSQPVYPHSQPAPAYPQQFAQPSQLPPAVQRSAVHVPARRPVQQQVAATVEQQGLAALGGQSVQPHQVAAAPRQITGGAAPRTAAAHQQPGRLAPQQGAPRLQQQQQAPQQLAPQQGAPAPQQQLAPQQPAPSNPAAEEEAVRSALAALGGFEEAEAAPAEPVQAPEAVSQAPQAPAAQAPVGSWQAKLPNGAVIRLTLTPSGQFQWVATNNGKSSQFAGSYTVSGDSLTLVRSDDNQQLAGKLTLNGAAGFNFKLDNAQDAGLDFTRA